MLFGMPFSRIFLCVLIFFVPVNFMTKPVVDFSTIVIDDRKLFKAFCLKYVYDFYKHISIYVFSKLSRL